MDTAEMVTQTGLVERLETLVRLALEEDLGTEGDITSLATLRPEQRVTGQITAKAPGVIAGLVAVTSVYMALSPEVVITPHVADGALVEPGSVVCDVHGSARDVMAGERTALNFLGRLSGIATQTRQYVDTVNETGAVILDTRKTTPGWRLLEKYAVRVGGGENHRLGLYDEVLIKDNHIDAAGGVTAAIHAVKAYPRAIGKPLVVEVKDLDELREALDAGVTRVLLDNMVRDTMREAVKIVGGRTPLEASGGLTLDEVRAAAETGVDYISIGALTHSAHVLDLSMRLKTNAT